MASVYVIRHKSSGKGYVGFTSLAPEARWHEHRAAARRKGANRQAITGAIRKHGADAFVFHALATGMSVPFALALEAAAIQALGTQAPAGYNLTTGGEHYTHSDESKAKTSAALRGRKRPPEVVAKVAAALRGKHHTDETKAKVSASSKGRLHTDAAKAKVSAAQTSPHKAEALALLEAGVPRREIRQRLGVSRTSVCRWDKERLAGKPAGW